MTKVLILNDIHAGVSHLSTSRPGGLYRQANNEALTTLETYVPKFNRSLYDLVVNLGDAISDTNNRDGDMKLLNSSLGVFSQIQGEKVFIPGNHEYKVLTEDDIHEVMKNVGIENVFNGLLKIEDTTFVWIKSLIGEKDLASISNETLTWLDQLITPGSNVVLFSHYSIPSLNGKDNFYFDQGHEFMSYTNGDVVLNMMERCGSAVTINAHTHMSTYKKTGKVSSVSALSFTENIVAMKYPDANPGIYSELEIAGTKKYFRSYSGEFCFLNVEL